MTLKNSGLLAGVFFILDFLDLFDGFVDVIAVGVFFEDEAVVLKFFVGVISYTGAKVVIAVSNFFVFEVVGTNEVVVICA